MSSFGGIVKIVNGTIKIGKGIVTGESEDVFKGIVKVARGTVKTIGGVVTGDIVEGGEISKEAEEEY